MNGQGEAMNIDWDQALDQIFSRRLVCPRCHLDQDAIVVGYSRKESLNPYAPRHGDCPRGADCDARKLITLCEDCAQLEHFRGDSLRGGPGPRQLHA